MSRFIIVGLVGVLIASLCFAISAFSSGSQGVFSSHILVLFANAVLLYSVFQSGVSKIQFTEGKVKVVRNSGDAQELPAAKIREVKASRNTLRILYVDGTVGRKVRFHRGKIDLPAWDESCQRIQEMAKGLRLV